MSRKCCAGMDVWGGILVIGICFKEGVKLVSHISWRFF